VKALGTKLRMMPNSKAAVSARKLKKCVMKMAAYFRRRGKDLVKPSLKKDFALVRKEQF